ncbi:MAG: 3-hydroxyacyl-CoA dehydrogenase family protein [Hyphomicrobiales bacterium]|nr:3-hydroxyacyl-CoA dehydrogenase family protein [Hyphomicrobiales bacterium]
MGPGIAARLARGGIEVMGYDTAADAINRAAGMVAVADGVLDRLGVDPPQGNPGSVRFASSVAEAVDGADLVIENVPENLDIKAATYREIELLIDPSVIVATDTSGIPISKLQSTLASPQRFVGMHWSNPPHIIPMIEVIGGEGTAPETVETIRDFIRGLGLLPVVVKKDVPGLVENRVLYALLREAVDLVERGVIDPEDLDTCVSWGIGYKIAVIGPMALLDMAGMDIYHSVSSFLNADLCDRDDVAPLARKQIEADKLGIKSGEGLYAYTPERIAALQKDRAAKLVAIRRILEGGD